MIKVFYEAHLQVELPIEKKMHVSEWKKRVQTSPIDRD